MNQRRILLPLAILLVGTVIYTVRLFGIQIISPEYQIDARNNARRVVRIEAPRGHITDRHGALLASNQIAYSVDVTPSKLPEDMDSAAVCQWLDIEQIALRKALQRAVKYSRLKPSVVLSGITEQQLIAIQEKLLLFPGFSLQQRVIRDYPGQVAANILGYVNEVNDYWLERNPDYHLGDGIGISGIEAQYESELRGSYGFQYRTVDHLNRDQGAFMDGAYDQDPVAGQNIQLSIDKELQAFGDKLMTGKRGSVVAIDPQTGEILAMISSPHYNPNALVGRFRSENYNRLAFDSLNKPLYNRGLLAEYPPGSPFKVINALIALQEGAATARTSYRCIDGYHFGELHIGCHCGGGQYDLRRSIERSCNTYHCQIFKRSIEQYPTASEGLAVYEAHAESFGLGRFLGVDFPTGRRGLIPGPEYYDRWYGQRRWKAPTIISNAIGQGELVVTPIQLANMTAAVANRGHWFTPHAAIRVGDSVVQVEKHVTTIDPEHFVPVIQGMADVFRDGTARMSAIPHLSMAGKTGTAENPHGQDHSIFIAFAPIDQPKIAMAIIVENGYWGSRWAAPIASLMMESYVTGEVTRPDLVERMVQGHLYEEYGVPSIETELKLNSP